MKTAKKYTEVYIDIGVLKIDHAFDYRLPPEMAGDAGIGSIVLVPFKNRLEIGYIAGFKDESSHDEKQIKDISRLLNNKPVFDRDRFSLMKWMSTYYIQAPGSVLKLFLPPGRKSKNDFKNPKIKLKFKDHIKLNDAALEKAGSKINFKKAYSQKKIIDYLSAHGVVSREKLLKESGSNASSLKSMIDKNLVTVESRRQKRNFFYDFKIPGQLNKSSEITLNKYQEQCVNAINSRIGKGGFHRFLVEGVTGSGKTEIYIEACRKVMGQNKKALVLTPEISLTPQLFSRFESEFGGRVAVYHSNMGEAERYERWLDIWNDRVEIIIGTRSALFTPVNGLGLIIIDEEHDPSYKESTRVRYNSRDVAMRLAGILDIPVVFGSATPSVGIRYRAGREDGFSLLKIPLKAAGKHKLAREIVDLRKIDRAKEDTVITRKLFTAIREELDKDNKVIIFINRRGFSNFVICSKCGNVPNCPACELSFNYHSDRAMLICHHCSREARFTGICPECGEKNMFLYGTGIQKVESKLKTRFPDIPIYRMDSDIKSKKKSHQDILSKFASPGRSILVGTQMVAKGLDIGDVTLVGVINCDGMLGLPDFHMNERVYQLITQVSGRAGRKHKKGRVIVQTYRPDSNVIKHIMDENYELFYEQELEDRKELGYPPFSNIINIIVSGKEEERAKGDARKLFAAIGRAIKNGSKILGPAQAPFYKINKFYRWHMIIKTDKIDETGNILSDVVKQFKKYRENRIIIDVDPVWIL
ncbi:MAG: primosomal protein N' [Deltaproteobacteria bacterium]|nr:primosomal protein N' [Deltaproteobacteria bacterium]